MSAAKPKPHQPQDATRQQLIKAATGLFAAHGFDGTSVKDIAEAAGVNISLVSYHFGGKEGLLKTCLEGFGQERLASARRILQEPKSREEFKVRLTLFIEEFFSYHFEHKDLVQILHREADLARPTTCEVFKETFIEEFKTLVNFLDRARDSGILKKDLQSLILAGHFMGGLIHFLRFATMGEQLFNLSLRDPGFRTAVTQQTVDVLLNGAANDPAGVR